MKNIRWTVLAALVLAAPTTVFAQVGPPGAPAGGQASAQLAPGASDVIGGTPGAGAPGATTASADGGSISNASGSSVDSSMTSTTTTTTSPGMETMATDTTTLGNTGGEPLLMSLAGISLSAGAFFLRRRVLS